MYLGTMYLLYLGNTKSVPNLVSWLASSMWYAASLSPEELGAYADARVCLHRARYIRKAHINFLPQSEKPVALTFLNEISSAKVQSASPKLELKATRLKLPRTGETAPQCIKLTFVDERTIDLDLNKIVRLRCLPASAPTPYRQPPPPPAIQLPMAAPPPPHYHPAEQARAAPQDKTRDIYSEIESENGRLEYEAMVRGKPWI